MSPGVKASEEAAMAENEQRVALVTGAIGNERLPTHRADFASLDEVRARGTDEGVAIGPGGVRGTWG